MSRIKTFSFYILSLLIIFAIFEVLSSTFLIYWYRFTGSIFKANENGTLSSVVFLNKALYAIQSRSAADLDLITSDPKPFYHEDPVIGYYTWPGRYIVTFRHRSNNPANSYMYLKTKVTFTEDSTRWVGGAWKDTDNAIYVFGDSYVFGVGVNDEQTFSYLLRQSVKNTNVKLLANGGYSLTQAFINFERLKDKIAENDVIILGYANFYKVRHVAAPSRTREWGEPSPLTPPDLTYPKASLDANGAIKISQTPLYCKFDEAYCKQDDPPKEEMDKVTAALINHIARNTHAKVYLLHINGKPDDQVFKLLDKSVQVISALPRDFDYVIKDDILGFDPHPGPWWHYAMFRKLTETLARDKPGITFDPHSR